MPEEILAIVIVSIVFGSIISIVKTVLSYRERTRFGTQPRQIERTSSAEGTSLTTSELQQMMRDAVSDATRPLADRLDALEDRMETRRQVSSGDDVVKDPIEPTPVRKTIGGQVR